MNPKDAPNGSEIPVEIDFSSGTRGKFFQQNAVLNLPVDLDTKTQDSRRSTAKEKGVEVSAPTNGRLK
ncbi:MAG: hypothetical protein Q7U82_12420 [Gammaproteobacteria bacterium]|nr:hypothetical protein [Gammaproteobacteria bacterium]